MGRVENAVELPHHLIDIHRRIVRQFKPSVELPVPIW